MTVDRAALDAAAEKSIIMREQADALRRFQAGDGKDMPRVHFAHEREVATVARLRASLSPPARELIGRRAGLSNAHALTRAELRSA